MQEIREKVKQSYKELKGVLGIKNEMASPRLLKVAINSGVGSVKDERKRELVRDRISRIAGQRARVAPARKSIASFKVREGDPIGVQVVLRGDRMYAFLDKLIHIALPRTRDFQGIDPKAIDEMGNLTIGIREHTVFPETADEDIRDTFGFAVTVVSTAPNKEKAREFFRAIGFPLKR